ncbi:uncharacterized protein LOC129564970 [Sitodiplosis mosellana]|uniref:uncharacterized protein LOC129564970 n=1 Tax=Sitodiplosis mosellana TaxID=263140 RepID=UPI0024452B58|nr:uncharacterized protein LOC129564970 [Sitodiplosis mosellana]
MENSKKLFVCFLLAIGVGLSSACNGYKARLVKMENCGGADQVLKIDPNVTVSLTKNCEIAVKGCAETTGFKTCTVKYTILKNGNRITSGNTDVCSELQKDSKGVATALMSFGLPKNCPVDKMRQCSDGSQKIDISKHKSLMPLAMGNIDISIDATHDTGKSCLHAVLNIDVQFCYQLADLCHSSNGYKMNLISVMNCAENNVLMVDQNLTATLSKDCFLTTIGCISSKGFKEAKVNYTVSKNGNVLLSGNPDLCSALDHKTKEQKEKLEMFGIPSDCPVPEGRKCMDGSKKVDISKFKNMLPMAAGRITVRDEITHDTGKTCVEIKFEVSK